MGTATLEKNQQGRGGGGRIEEGSGVVKRRVGEGWGGQFWEDFLRKGMGNFRNVPGRVKEGLGKIRGRFEELVLENWF